MGKGSERKESNGTGFGEKINNFPSQAKDESDRMPCQEGESKKNAEEKVRETE